MPAVIALLVNLLRVMLFTQGGRIIVGILGFFGLQMATNKFAVQPAMDQIASMMQGAPSGDFGATALQWMGVLKFDIAVSMLISAVVMKYAIQSAKVFLSKV